MRPITFFDGIIFACSTAISLALGVLLLMRLLLLADQSVNPTVVTGQLPVMELVRYAVTIALVAVCAGWAFFGQLFAKPWRGRAQAAQVVAIVSALAYLLSGSDQRVQVLEGLALVAGVIAVGWGSGLFKRIWSWVNADQP